MVEEAEHLNAGDDKVGQPAQREAAKDQEDDLERIKFLRLDFHYF